MPASADYRPEEAEEEEPVIEEGVEPEEDDQIMEEQPHASQELQGASAEQAVAVVPLAVPTTAAQALGPPATEDPQAAKETEAPSTDAAPAASSAAVAPGMTSLYASLVSSSSVCPVQGARALAERLRAGDDAAATPRRAPARPQQTYKALPPELRRYHERAAKARARMREESLVARQAAAREAHAKRKAEPREVPVRQQEQENAAAADVEAASVEVAAVPEGATSAAAETKTEEAVVLPEVAVAKKRLVGKRKAAQEVAVQAETQSEKADAPAADADTPKAQQKQGSKQAAKTKKQVADVDSAEPEKPAVASDSVPVIRDVDAQPAETEPPKKNRKLVSKTSVCASKANSVESQAVDADPPSTLKKTGGAQATATAKKQDDECEGMESGKQTGRKGKASKEPVQDKGEVDGTEADDCKAAAKKAKVASDEAKASTKAPPKAKLSAEEKKFLSMTPSQRSKMMMKMNLTQQMKLAKAISLAEGGG